MERAWTIELCTEVRREIAALPNPVRRALGTALLAVEIEGPDLGRPTVDTLKGSRHANMKELRFGSDGSVWRFAFAFDPERSAVVLVGGDKQGRNERRFYRWLVETADVRFDRHLKEMEQ